MSTMAEIDLLRQEYINEIIEGCDMGDLEDMARCHLENSITDDADELLDHIRAYVPHLLVGTRFEKA